MAPKKSTKKTVVDVADPAAAAEVPGGSPEEPLIEEVVAESAAPEPSVVTFMMGGPLGEDDEPREDEDDEEEDDEEEGDELVGVVGQMGQLLMTDEGEAITDVLAGIRDALDKQNKILYRGLQLLERRG